MGPKRRESQGERTVVAVGLTGSIGAGKSTALGMFAECGTLALSADEIVHRLYERPEVVSVLTGHFGRRILAPDDAIDRARLAEAVHGRSDELRWLEGVTHPLVADEIAQSIQRAPQGSVVICEVPLMFDTGFERLFDLVVTVEADPEVRRSRSTHQFGLGQFEEFEALQASRERRVTGSDMVFVNDGGIEELRDFVSKVCERARHLLAPKLREARP